MKNYLSISLLLLLLSLSVIEANTEIINFNSQQHYLNLTTIPSTFTTLKLNQPLSLKTTIKNEQYFKLILPLSSTSISIYDIVINRLGLESLSDYYTVRLSWPASYPNSFHFLLFSSTSTSTTSQSQSQIEEKVELILKLTSHSTGVLFPSFSSSSSTSSTTSSSLIENELKSIPCTILLEKNYFGFLPESSLNLVFCILIIIIFSWFGISRVIDLIVGCFDRLEEGKESRKEE